MNKITVLVFICPFLIFGQEDKNNSASLLKKGLKFEVIPIEQGLSNKAIPAIIEDRVGFLWFATQDGLNKYNGYEFEVFQNDPSDPNTISNNNIFSLILDNDGYLWLGTENGGLNRFDPNTEKVIRFLHDDNDPKSISSNNVYCINESKKGELWIGTLESGIDVLNKKTGKIIKRYKCETNNANSVSKGAIWDIHEDPEGNMWIATWGGGLDKLDPKTGNFKHYRHDAKNPNSISCDIIGSIFEDGNILWVTTWGGGLNKFDPLKETFKAYIFDPKNLKSIGSNLTWPMVKDNEGNLWIGTYGSGVNKFDFKTETFERYSHDVNNLNSLNFNDVWSLHFDRSGILWIGTEGGGISKFVRLKKQVDFYKNAPGNPFSIGHNSVRAIAEDSSGIIWIGTWDGGLDKLDLHSKKITNFKKDLKDGNNTGLNKIKTIFCSPDGKIWLGSYRGGLVEFDKRTGSFTFHKNDPLNDRSISDNYVYSIASDKWGCIWVGTLNGLNIFKPSTNEFLRFKHDPDNDNSISNNTINKIYLSKNGTLWIGTDIGLNKFNDDKKTFSHFYHDAKDSSSLTHNTVYAIYEDMDGTLWIGTRNGLERYIATNKTFEHFTTKNGLPDNMIMAIQEDNHSQLFISTKKGISRFNKESKTFINYSINDGIHGQLFFPNASCKSKTGKVYFGSTEGLDSFYPDSIENNKYVPPIIITSLKQQDEKINFDNTARPIKEIILPYFKNNLTFEYVALSYASPEDNQYSIKLEGIDQNWQYNGNKRSAYYANLLPGTYIFKVKASNNDGLWNEEGAVMKIIITPPFWKTTWFFIACILTGILFVIAFIKYRERKLNREKKLLEEKVEERTLEVVHQKELAEEKHKEITDSINYAERIQRSFLATKNLLDENLKDYFVFFQPKDIVSGDFYWASKLKNGNFALATADSTGHGVPGAIMSLLNITSLEKAIETLTQPSDILNATRKTIIERLKKDGSEHGGKDGMDTSLTVYDFKNKKLIIAAANNPVWIVRGTETIDIKADKMPVGKHDKDNVSFIQQEIDLQKGDIVYTLTDGFPDQFGGEKGKKFMSKNLRELLSSNTHLLMAEQKELLELTFKNWVGNLEQVDDVTLIGVRI